jgi:hypothetical protein
MDPKPLKRRSSGSAELYRWPIHKDLAPAHIVVTMSMNNFIHRPINLGDVHFALNWIVLALPFLASFGSGRFIIDDATYLWSKEAKHFNEAKPEWRIRLSPWTRSESLLLQVCCGTWIHVVFEGPVTRLEKDRDRTGP